MGRSHEIEYIPLKIYEYCTDEILRREGELLEGFFMETRDADRVISYNGKRFDSTFLFIRGIYHDLDIPQWILDRKIQDTIHIDVLYFLSRGYYDIKFSLDFVCRGMGLKTPKAKYDGSMVRNMFIDVRHKEISKYCALDTIVLVYLYMRLLKYMKINCQKQTEKASESQVNYCLNLVKELLKLNSSESEIKGLLSEIEKDTAAALIGLLKKLKEILRNA
ncbi:ribonuclease H-like domain-containing protein [Thermodesulfovibrio sp.]|uniref:ribonuclease H-like domain-containing protein n=1 Tax=Thermodesulfovibrio sp. TaxID=2067987 RepID=UPI0030A7E9E3